jgi:hypothetical protein
VVPWIAALVALRIDPLLSRAAGASRPHRYLVAAGARGLAHFDTAAMSAPAKTKSVQVFGRKRHAVAVALCKEGKGVIRLNGQPLHLVEPAVLRVKVRSSVQLHRAVAALSRSGAVGGNNSGCCGCCASGDAASSWTAGTLRLAVHCGLHGCGHPRHAFDVWPLVFELAPRRCCCFEELACRFAAAA